MGSCGGAGMAILLLRAGFDVADEPFVHDLLCSLCCRVLLQIELKARILVPGAVCLMGVMDEYGVLGAGEVFAHYQDRRTGAYHILRDLTVAVGRNPSLHPGDI